MPHPEKCSKEDVLNRGLLSPTAPSVEHQSTHTGPWNHCGWGHTRPCQSTEFQQIGALWQDLAGLNRLNRFVNAKCLQNKDKQRSFGWIFNTVWKRSWEGQLFPNELTGRSLKWKVLVWKPTSDLSQNTKTSCWQVLIFMATARNSKCLF